MINGWIMSGLLALSSLHGRFVSPLQPERGPPCLQKAGDLEMWLESRAIDRHRTNSRILKRILRLGDTSDLNSALHVQGATITDNYWVKTEDEANLTWADVGSRENYFADLALSGRFSSIAKNYTPKDDRQEYLAPIFSNYKPDEEKNEQMKEHFSWGLTENAIWQV